MCVTVPNFIKIGQTFAIYGNSVVFIMAAVRHLGFLKYKFLNGQGVYDTHFASSYQDGGRRHLGFLKIPNFNGQSAIRANMRHHVKFY